MIQLISMEGEMHGKVVVVTGAAGGIGTAISQAFGSAGASVAAWDLDGGRAKEVASGIGATAVGVEVDITNRASVEAALRATESAFGPIDVLVNNAGIDKIEPFLTREESAWERTVAVNF